MDFKTYCAERINKIRKEISQSEEAISNFPRQEDIKIEDYGNKKDILSRVTKQKGKKIRHLIFKPTKVEVKSFIRQKEISSLENHIHELQEEIKQLTNALESFNQAKNIFTKSVYPNDYILKAILNYIQNNNSKIAESFKILISLFKSLDTELVGLTGKIERDIGNQFNEDYKPIVTASISNITFSIDKLFKGIMGEGNLEKYAKSIEKIKNYIITQAKRDEQSPRDKLLVRQNAINELQKYIKDDEIISPAPSLKHFKEVLEAAGINPKVIQIYCEKMAVLLKEDEIKESLEIIKRNLTASEIEIWQKAKKLELEIDNQELKDLLFGITKDIVSACKYLELMPIPEQRDMTFEIITQKIDSLSSTINNIVSQESEISVFYYATNQDNIPYALLNIETIDTLQYEKIFRMFQALASGEIKHVSVYQTRSISLKRIEGTEVDIYYADICDKPIIVSIHPHILSDTELHIPKSVRDSIMSIIKSVKNEEFNKLQATYERLIIQSLDIRTLNDDRNTYKLKFFESSE